MPYSLSHFTRRSKQLHCAYISICIILLSRTNCECRLPEWTKSIFPSDWLDEVSLLYYTVPAYTPQLAKFRTGFFFKDILDRSTSKVNGTLSPDISAYVYSAHDINISTVLVGLGMWDVSKKKLLTISNNPNLIF